MYISGFGLLGCQICWSLSEASPASSMEVDVELGHHFWLEAAVE